MMYERPPPITPFQNPPRNTTLMFQQHQGESLYDAWTRFKNLIQRVPHYGLNLWYLSQFFYDHVDQYTQMDLDFAADKNIGKLGIEEAWETIKNFAQGQKENENVWVEMHRYIAWDKVDNPNQQNTSPSEINEPYEHSPRMDSYEQPSCLGPPKYMSWLDAYDEPIGDMEDKVQNPSPQSAPQVLSSFEVYTVPVAYPKEVDEIIGIPIEVEPLNQTQLEDLGLNTCSHDLFHSSREIPSVDEPGP
ncbi:hypothetical protein Tco_1016235 [Tanacetum coccineum]|uniref:Uncharacterized protein n=1 Tax=Tanacetum coccineum TaxID=301880 RepID=A0ABQ5FPA0_9ASTR